MMRLIAKYQPQSLRIGFLRQNHLNTHEAFLCLAQSILVTRAQPHTWVLSVVAFGKSHSEWSKHFLVRNQHQFPSRRIDFTLEPTSWGQRVSLFPWLWRPRKSALGTRLPSLQLFLYLYFWYHIYFRWTWGSGREATSLPCSGKTVLH